jgi:hypothetical protein
MVSKLSALTIVSWLFAGYLVRAAETILANDSYAHQLWDLEMLVLVLNDPKPWSLERL